MSVLPVVVVQLSVRVEQSEILRWQDLNLTKCKNKIIVDS